jgi:hypothetical protein
MDFWKQSNRSSGPLFGKKTPGPNDTTLDPKSSGQIPGAKAEAAKPEQKSAATKSTINLKVAATNTPMPTSGLSRAALKFDHDLACGVMVGAFEIPGMVVTIDTVEHVDPNTKRAERTSEWLRTNDMLAILTRTYGMEQQKLSQFPTSPMVGMQSKNQQMKDREEVNRRLNELREQIVCLLHSRRAYHKAKEHGITVLIPA